MMTKHSKTILLAAVALVAFTSAIPKNVYDIKNLARAQEAEAQLLGGGGGGIMQSLMPILMMMMMMNMMNQNKGNQLQREQAQAAKNANSNLMKAGTQSNGGVQPGLTNPSTNPVSKPITNPLDIPIGAFIAK